MNDPFLEKSNQYLKEGLIEEKYYEHLKVFYSSYCSAVSFSERNIKLFLTFLDLVKKQFKDPYKFQLYHKKVRTPFDYYAFGLDFLKPLIEEGSKVLGQENLNLMLEQLKKGENLVFLANHQTESDPQALSILLEKNYPLLAEQTIYVAGERVLTDPLAVPFSMGCDLLCIYSKKYMETPQELKREKQLHNKKTMLLMSSLFKEGSKIIYVAPSGGRDRLNEKGEIELSPFDPQSIEMFYLMAKKSQVPTHFYPLSLSTYNLMPPPKTIQIEIGELRRPQKAKIHAFFGQEIDFENCCKNNHSDKVLKRQKRAEYIYALVKQNYNYLRSL